MSETNPPPVAPVVTSEMVEFAYSAWRSSLHNILPEDQCVQDHYDAMRAAITAALEASGELERLRAALQNIRAIAAKSQHEGGPDGILKTIEEFAVYGLEGKNP